MTLTLLSGKSNIINQVASRLTVGVWFGSMTFKPFLKISLEGKDIKVFVCHSKLEILFLVFDRQLTL